ncbi:MAG: hypothetical protein DMG59_23495 [Acidobacteria bacterium]|nr:MAG: hypothetical protein DMG59_23495 [Acidobacteriota bacterium]
MNGSNPSLVSAIRGPVMLITLGVLLAMDHNGTISFGRTWPVLLIMFGVFKLAERAGAKSA